MRPTITKRWADNLGVEQGELLSQVRGFLRLIDEVDERVLRLRIMLHRSPDRDVDDALLQLERRVRAVQELLRDVHTDVLWER